MHLRAVEPAVGAQPAVLDQPGRVDDQRVAVPSSDRVAHPRPVGVFVVRAAVGRNRAERVAPLVEQHDEARRLHDLAGRPHARHAERLAVERRVVELALVGQQLHLRCELRLVRRLVRLGRLAFLRGTVHLVEDALVVGVRPHREEDARRFARCQRLDRLGAPGPHTVQIGMPVGGPRRRLAGGRGTRIGAGAGPPAALRERGRGDDQREAGDDEEPPHGFSFEGSPSQISSLWPSAKVIVRRNARLAPSRARKRRHRPLRHRALVVFHVQVDVDVRVDPVDLGDRSLQRDRLVDVVFRLEGAMRQRRSRGAQQRERESHSTPHELFHRSLQMCGVHMPGPRSPGTGAPRHPAYTGPRSRGTGQLCT